MPEQALDLEGACLGVAGLGSIGRRVARLCRGLGMHVLASGPGLTGPGEPGVKLVPLDELVARADVISLHCELPERLRGLVEPGPSSRSSSRARSSSNVARGQIVLAGGVEGVLAAELLANVLNPEAVARAAARAEIGFCPDGSA